MISKSHFEKVSFEQYYEDRLNYLDFDSNYRYLSENGIYDDDIWNACFNGDDFKEHVKPNSILEAKVKQLFYKEYENITIPTRGTMLSAGYDFICPFNVEVKFSDKLPIKIPTGIRYIVDESEMTPENIHTLKLYHRSSTGIKKGLCLTNGVGIIDIDYFESDNEGDIIVSLNPVLNNDAVNWIRKGENEDYTDSPNVVINSGEKFAQGILVPIIITEDDAMSFYEKNKRNGGIGSTGR